MTIKKVTVDDLKEIHGGARRKGRGKVKRGEKIAVKDMTKDYGKDLEKKNTRIKSSGPVTITIDRP